MHPAVFHGFGAVPSYLIFRVNAQKLSVRFVEMRDDAVSVGYHGTIVNAVENELIHFKLFSKFITVKIRICPPHAHLL
jgi:hypothetical protein